MTDDRLRQLRARLDALDGVPVSRHPDALDEVHRALVAELEGLAGSRAADPQPSVGEA